MKYTHFDDIKPNNKTDFIMLYFAACRSLRELQAAIRRTNGGKLTCRQAWLLRRIQNKFVQMVARLKATQRNEIPNTPNAKYQTGIVIDLKSPQGNVFYLMGLWLIGLYGNLACLPKKSPNASENKPAQQHTKHILSFYANGSGLCLSGVMNNPFIYLNKTKSTAYRTTNQRSLL